MHRGLRHMSGQLVKCYAHTTMATSKGVLFEPQGFGARDLNIIR